MKIPTNGVSFVITQLKIATSQTKLDPLSINRVFCPFLRTKSSIPT